jgi:protein-tyrosine phosphatase
MAIDWLDLSRAPDLATAAGRLGLTGLIGATGLRRSDGVDRLVLLVEDHELGYAGTHGTVTELGREGIRVTRYPVVDISLPRDRMTFRSLIDSIRQDLLAGSTLVVACLGGIGRTGTAVGCLLVDSGLSGEEAIALVRSTRPGSIERPAQEAFVRGWREASGQSG